MSTSPDQVSPTPSQPDSPAAFDLRIGLVMFGGVSLAVYMGGVVQELLHLVRASQTGATGNAYGGLLRAAGADVEIDVIAGTSAGGLNGLVLAKALATGSDLLREMNTLWKDLAQIDTLVQVKTPGALLDGKLLETHLTNILQKMTRSPNANLAGKVKVLDLFVTATDLKGQVVTTRDDLFGQTVRAVRNQHLFRLRLRRRDQQTGRGYEQNDFTHPDPGVAAARDRLLARVGRATSAFPVAFAPQEMSRAECAAAGLEHLLPDDDRNVVWFADGGILMNKPFAPVLKTIFNRGAVRAVERVLLWLDPDPEEPEQEGATPAADGARPHILDSFAAPLTLPRNEDITVYLEQVRRQKEYRRQVVTAFRQVEETLAGKDGHDAGPLMESYRQVRRERTRTLLREALQRQFGHLPLGAALVAWVQQGLEERLPPGDPAWLDRWDFDYHVRRLHYLLLLLDDGQTQAPGEPDPDSRRQLRAAAGAMQARLWNALHEWRMARYTLGNLLKAEGQPELSRAFRELAAAPEVTQELLQAAVGRLAEYVEAVQKRAAEDEQAAWSCPVGAAPVCGQLQGRLREAATRYESRDVLLFPVLQSGQLAEWNQVSMGRISPRSTRRIPRDKHSKLASEGLGHFAGFLNRRWRHNDILWGRIDTLELICDMVTDRALAQGAGRAELEAAVEACFEQRLREILEEEKEILEMPRLAARYERMRAGLTAGGEPVPATLHPLLKQAAEPFPPAFREAVQRQWEQAAFSGQALAEKYPPGLQGAALIRRAPLQVLLDYLTYDHNIGRETVADLPWPALIGSGVRALTNLHRALRLPATGLTRVLAGLLAKLLRPLLLVIGFLLMDDLPFARRLLLPYWAGTLAGLTLLLCHGMGWMRLALPGWLLVGVLLLPLAFRALCSRFGAFLALAFAAGGLGLGAADMAARAFGAPPSPADLLPAGAVAPAALGAAAVTALALGLMQWPGHPPAAGAAPDRAGLPFRFLLIAGYAPLLALLTARGGGLLAGWWAPLVAPAAYLAWAPVAAGLVDALESFALFQGPGGREAEGWPRLARGCAAVKFVLLGLAAPVALVGLVGWLTGLIR